MKITTKFFLGSLIVVIVMLSLVVGGTYWTSEFTKEDLREPCEKLGGVLLGWKCIDRVTKQEIGL